MLRKIQNALKQPSTWIAFVVGGIAALSIGFIGKLLSPAAAVVNKVVPKG